jgi:hypothetical protein
MWHCARTKIILSLVSYWTRTIRVHSENRSETNRSEKRNANLTSAEAANRPPARSRGPCALTQ